MYSDIKEYARKRMMQLKEMHPELGRAELAKMTYEDCRCRRAYDDEELEQLWMMVEELSYNLCDCD